MVAGTSYSSADVGFIISELNEVKGKCGNEKIMGRINNYSVNMLLANMYINHNAWFNDDSDKSWYGKCIDELNEIIESGLYSLAPNYLDNSKKIFPVILKLSLEYLIQKNMEMQKFMNVRFVL